MQISEERKRRVIELYFNQHKTYTEIAKIERISPCDIHAMVKEEQARRQKYEHKQHQEELSSKAYKLFAEGKRPVEVAIALNLRQPDATKLYNEYWKLKRMHVLNSIFKETNGKLGPILKLYKLLIKQRGMSIEQVVNAIDTAVNRLPHTETLYIQARDETQKMQQTRHHLLNVIKALEYKISILDKTAFSCEQDCKRKEQQLQELIAQKDRLEKWIANVSNNDELKQIVKEYVKAILAENKQVISVSFTVLIQMLKADPEMMKLIYNISTTNVGDEHKDNSNNITKYLESNKFNILDLAEKQYENLVEELTNNAINNVINAGASSPPSDPKLSSMFPRPSNGGDTYRRIERQRSFHNSEDDIAD